MRNTLSRVLLVCLSCLPALAQSGESEIAAQEEIRQTLDAFHAARRAGGGDKAAAYLAPGAKEYSSGGTTLMLLGRVRRPPTQRTSTLIRHVQLLSPETAVAIGLWHTDDVAPPEDSGLRDYFLVRKDGAWKIAGWRGGFVRSARAASPSVDGPEPAQDSLSAEERAAGWKSLFDGKSMDGWVTMTGKSTLPPSWRIVDGCLATAAAQPVTSIRTRREYKEFELAFEWMVAAKGNSGVKYRLFAVETWANGDGADAAGFEYQIADDDGDPGARVDPRQKSGALYGVVPVSKPMARAPGMWNESRIVVGKEHIEHWLNGEIIAKIAVDVSFPSPVALQHHSSEVRFRKLKIRGN